MSKYATITGIVLETMIKKFWPKVDKQPGGCWLWTGGTSSGYGVIYISAPADRLTVYTHVFAWFLVTGRWPLSMLCHGDSCEKTCCNPDHLYEGDARSNALDYLRVKEARSKDLTRRFN